MSTVFITGASGYIAQHIIKHLFQKGYKVVGTVRSAEKGEKLVKRFATKSFSYEIVKDIGAANAFDDALKRHPEVSVFLHTASPVDMSITDFENDMIKPAVNGVLNALKAVKSHGPQVTNVVSTSSFLAYLSLSPEDQGKTLTEESWNPVTEEQSKLNLFFGYSASKTFAEKAAWKFMEEEKPHFAFNTVAPSYVFGPHAYGLEKGDALGFTTGILHQAISSKPGDEAPQHGGGFIDVRDVAKAHVHAFESSVKNTRYLLVSGQFVGQDILDVLNDMPQLKGKIATGKPGTAEEYRKALTPIDNTKTRQLLDSWTPFKETVTESAEQLLAANIVDV